MHPIATIFGVAVLAVSLSANAQTYTVPSGGGAVAIQVSAITHSGCGEVDTDPYTGNPVWQQRCNGYSQATVTFPVSGRYEFDISAYANLFQGPPVLELGIDGAYTTDHSVNVDWPAMSAWSTYVFLANVTAGTHTVQLGFFNDFYQGTPQTDRNLFVETLSISNPAPPPNPDAVPDQYWNTVPLIWYPVNTAAYPTPDAAMPTNREPGQASKHKGCNFLRDSNASYGQNCNGYAEYVAVFPNTGSYQFDVSAYGDQFQGAPLMTLSVDGAALGTVSVAATTLTTYSFVGMNISAGQHLVEVGLINDYYQQTSTTDRNLVVNAVDIRALGQSGAVEYVDMGVGGESGVGTYSAPPEASGNATGTALGWSSALTFNTSTNYPNTTRNYYVYIPTAVNKTQATAFMVWQDGGSQCNPSGGWKLPTILDHLIAAGSMPPTILVCVNPGAVAGTTTSGCAVGDNDCERSFEYDSVNDRYFHFITDELLPYVAKTHGLTFTTDPTKRGAGGGSSGGIASFTLGWFHPESFRKIYGASPSFTNIRSHGGNQYPAMIAAKSPIVPLRFAMAAGTHDLDCFGNVGANCTGNPHAWADAAKRVSAALNAKNYPYRFTFGSETHEGGTGTSHLATDLAWIWSQ